jgi:hypothetical protein
MAEEMRFHLEQRAADRQADGLSPEEARHAAERKFGNIASLQEQAREGPRLAVAGEPAARSPPRRPLPREVPRLHPHRHPDARPWHRRQHLDVQPRQRDHAEAPALRRRGPPAACLPRHRAATGGRPLARRLSRPAEGARALRRLCRLRHRPCQPCRPGQARRTRPRRPRLGQPLHPARRRAAARPRLPAGRGHPRPPSGRHPQPAHLAQPLRRVARHHRPPPPHRRRMARGRRRAARLVQRLAAPRQRRLLPALRLHPGVLPRPQGGQPPALRPPGRGRDPRGGRRLRRRLRGPPRAGAPRGARRQLLARRVSALHRRGQQRRHHPAPAHRAFGLCPAHRLLEPRQPAARPDHDPRARVRRARRHRRHAPPAAAPAPGRGGAPFPGRRRPRRPRGLRLPQLGPRSAPPATTASSSGSRSTGP